MTDEQRPNPRPNPRPAPRSADTPPHAAAPAPRDAADRPAAAGAGAGAGAERPAPAGRPPAAGRPRRTPPNRPTPTRRSATGPSRRSSNVTEPTQAVAAVTSERVLVGAGAPVASSGSSVFALDPPPAEPIDLDTPGEWVRLPRRSGPGRRALLVVLVFGLIALVTGLSASRWLHGHLHPAGPHGDPVQFTIEQGQATNTVANNLASKRVIANATVFRYWLRRQGGDTTFKAGDYDLFERMDYPELLSVLRAGPKPPVQIRVTIPPGLSILQMRKLLLEKLPGFNATEFDQALARPQIGAPYAPGVAWREGLLFPDTYNIDEDASSNEYALLLRMRSQMDKVLKDLNAEQRAAFIGSNVYDVLKVASLIEEEAKIDGDRAKISRVIYNRLDRGMTLGIDASTRFAVGKINGEPLTVSDLNSDNPYNTRKVAGLPPTPIALPSKASIEAALAPAEGRWLYYVLTDEGGVKGAHTFANTQAEFNAAVSVCRRLGYCD
jgi:UPF0755 protein